MAANYRLVGRGFAAAVGRRLAVAAAVRGCLGSVAVGWSLVSRSRLVGGSWLVGWSWLVDWSWLVTGSLVAGGGVRRSLVSITG